MTTFEFLLVTVSIIIGIGIAELLAGVVRILRGELEAGPLHSIWVLIVLLLQFEVLWAQWELRVRSEWTFPEFLLFALTPLVLFVASALLFPAQGAARQLDAHYFARNRPFFSVMVVLLLAASLEDWILAGESVGGGQDLFRALAAVLFVLAASTRTRWIHWCVGLAFLAELSLFILSFAFGVSEAR
jgi:hypothetical protein